MFKCGICGKEFDDIEEYLTHVSNCAVKKKEDESKKKEEELKKAKKVNEFVENIKILESQLKSMKDEFAKKYPKEYEMNFGNKSITNEPQSKFNFFGKIDNNEYHDFDSFMKAIKEV